MCREKVQAGEGEEGGKGPLPDVRSMSGENTSLPRGRKLGLLLSNTDPFSEATPDRETSKSPEGRVVAEAHTQPQTEKGKRYNNNARKKENETERTHQPMLFVRPLLELQVRMRRGSCRWSLRWNGVVHKRREGGAQRAQKGLPAHDDAGGRGHIRGGGTRGGGGRAGGGRRRSGKCGPG